MPNEYIPAGTRVEILDNLYELALRRRRWTSLIGQVGTLARPFNVGEQHFVEVSFAEGVLSPDDPTLPFSRDEFKVLED